jgi:hypothetical protein
MAISSHSILSTFGSNTDTGTIPLFSDAEVLLLPGAIMLNPEPTVVQPEKPVKIQQAAEDFEEKQRGLQAINLRFLGKTIRLLESKKILLPSSSCNSEFCCGIAKNSCSEHRSDSGCADLMVCCLLGSSCAVLGFLAKIKGFFCADVFYDSFEALNSAEANSIQDTLVSININDITASALPVSQYQNLLDRLIRKKQELESESRLRAAFNLFHPAIAQSPMPEEIKKELPTEKALDIIERQATSRRLSL